MWAFLYEKTTRHMSHGLNFTLSPLFENLPHKNRCKCSKVFNLQVLKFQIFELINEFSTFNVFSNPLRYRKKFLSNMPMTKIEFITAPCAIS